MIHFLYGEISIVGYTDFEWRPCLGRDLHMFYYDGNNYFYFDMDDPVCYDDNLKKDPRIPEYIEFYNEMAAFIKQDFSACRWDNFGNKDKMIEECSQYNWKWRERYGKQYSVRLGKRRQEFNENLWLRVFKTLTDSSSRLKAPATRNSASRSRPLGDRTRFCQNTCKW